ncbi:MAG: hypothetical protein IJJ33_04175, partial [Victivallales bacterium]|nr:hypothetical protein [Victivallales bacterium]
MKGRLFVVNEETYESTIRTNIASVFVPDAFGTQWVKTIADLMADMLQIEIGDYIFLWETGSATRKNRIHGVFRAISAPFFEQTNPDEKDLFKVRIERAYTFEEALDEYDLLNCPFIKEPLWTIIGKKVAGKSRGTSPLSMDEVKFLINLLVGKNPNYRFIPFDSARIIEVANPLRINIVSRGDNPDINNSRDLFERTMTPADIHFFNEDGSPKYEKVLETIFNQEMADRNADFFSQIGIDVNKVIWYCNYLPY